MARILEFLVEFCAGILVLGNSRFRNFSLGNSRIPRLFGG